MSYFSDTNPIMICFAHVKLARRSFNSKLIIHVKVGSLRLLQLLLVSILAGNSFAQIEVLSEGADPQLQWRTAQLEMLDAQLARAEIKGQLRDELRAQKKWLSNWQPGEQTKESRREGVTKKPAQASQVGQEPILDPNKKASKLRAKLLGPNAHPTAADTKELQSALGKDATDIGLRQLHLHWLDRPQYRKLHAEDIADSAVRLAGLLSQSRPQTDEIRTAQAFCLYRRARALIYRELPEVIAERPLKDTEKHSQDLIGTANQLRELAGPNRPEFILVDIYMLRRDRWFGLALEQLENCATVVDDRWLLRERRDVLNELGWSYPAADFAAFYQSLYPDAAISNDIND